MGKIIVSIWAATNSCVAVLEAAACVIPIPKRAHKRRPCRFRQERGALESGRNCARPSHTDTPSCRSARDGHLAHRQHDGKMLRPGDFRVVPSEARPTRKLSARKDTRRSSPCRVTSPTASARPPRCGQDRGLEVLRIINEPTRVARLRPYKAKAKSWSTTWAEHLRRVRAGNRGRRVLRFSPPPQHAP
jgi:hypothetical protein